MITEVFFVSQYRQKHGRDIGPVEEDEEMRMICAGQNAHPFLIPA
jgi:hypothetical protein